MHTSQLLALVSLPLAALSLTACEPVTLALQEPVALLTPVAIEGGGKTRTIGDMTITRTKGGMISTTSGSAGPWGGEKIKQKFQYETSEGWAGDCAFSTGGQTIGGFDIAASGGMKCTVSKGDEHWDLDLAAVIDGSKRLSGTYSNGASSISVEMSDESNVGRGSFMGYTLAAEGTGVAAVQVTGLRQMWLVAETPNSDAIRASVGALLYSEGAVRQATQ